MLTKLLLISFIDNAFYILKSEMLINIINQFKFRLLGFNFILYCSYYHRNINYYYN